MNRRKPKAQCAAKHAPTIYEICSSSSEPARASRELAATFNFARLLDDCLDETSSKHDIREYLSGSFFLACRLASAQLCRPRDPRGSCIVYSDCDNYGYRSRFEVIFAFLLIAVTGH